MDDPAALRPVRGPGTRLIFSDDGSLIEDRSGDMAMAVTELESIVWRSFDGATTLGEIASDVAAARGSGFDEELSALVGLCDRLRQHRLLADRIAPGPDSVAPDPEEPYALGYDFVMNSYPITVDPTGRPTSRDVLLELFDPAAPERQAWSDLSTALIDAIGPDRTVWGAKQVDDRLEWELYFYPSRWASEQPADTVFATVREAVGDHIGWDAPTHVPDNTNLFSFELTFGPDGSFESPHEIDVYHPVEGSAAMIVAYRHNATTYQLKNTYEFFPLPGGEPALAARLDASRYRRAGTEGAISGFWSAELQKRYGVSGVWCSYKPDWDGVYFARIDIDDVIALVDGYSYPSRFVTWLREHRSELDHLLYDFGFDYRVGEDGNVDVVRTGFYGWF